MVPLEGRVVRKDAAQRLVFGFAVLATKSDGGPLVDLQGHAVDLPALERAAYVYVEEVEGGAFEKAAPGGEMHAGEARNTLVESFVITPEKLDALGIGPGTVPLGWWVGYRVPPDVYKRVEEGARMMFSIEGAGFLTPLAA